MQLTTCQICGRAIKANTGTIAHHGYKRPGHGWQTSSCFGAKYRSYEVASDALPPAIESLADYIARRQANLDTLMSDPPATLEYQRTCAWGRPQGPRRTFERPADFDSANHRASYTQESYVFQFDRIRSDVKRDIDAATENLAYLRKRLADWKEPVEQNEGAAA